MARMSGSISVLILVLSAVVGRSLANPPPTFDLRDVEGVSYVTSVKSQISGTCWTHGAMAALEGNLLMTGRWAVAGESGEPNLAEYHLDWWNGFNSFNNDDCPGCGGLDVHNGGDYMVTAAYLARAEGAVRDVDGQSFSSAPPRSDSSWHYYYPRHIEWYTAGTDLSKINLIKAQIMTHGVMGTCMCYDGSFINGSYCHYQPPGSTMLPNHAVAIVGWDDSKVTQAPQIGAWLCKNSWGSGWGLGGYFWISYYDKWCCQEPQMGAVSMQEVEPLAYDRIYYHDYHGWRDTLADCSEAFNAFTAVGAATGVESLQAVSFYCAADDVTFTIKVYDRFEGGILLDELAVETGMLAYRGFHTIDLIPAVSLAAGDDFYVYLQLSSGGQPYDRTSDVPVLLGASYRTIVESAANPGESYYWSGTAWQDLYDRDLGNPTWNQTANFCIKALTSEGMPLSISFPEGLPEYLAPGEPTTFSVAIVSGTEDYLPGSARLHYRYDAGAFESSPLSFLGGELFEATLPPAMCEDVPEYYLSAEGHLGSTMTSPANAPTEWYTAVVGAMVDVVTDDFQTDLGWTAGDAGDTATTGIWTRNVPEATEAQPGEDHTPPPGTMCWVTDYRAGGSLGDYDVDGGQTTLKSPTFDLSSSSGATVSYWRWYSNDTGSAPNSDTFRVDISNDDGGSWVNAETVGPAGPETAGGWFYHEFLVEEFVAPTNQIKLRFIAEDAESGSIVEAAIDDFQIAALECENPCPPADGDMDESGATDGADLQLFTNALLETPSQADICHGDFTGNGGLDTADIPGMVDALLAP